MPGIRKISVAKGISWVEVPEAGVYLQCGCPADSVKHLMKRGLIVPVEERGVRFETGPNALLLSDKMLQNGEFANLAEFPILQMLYRQGMLIPGHVRNTGEKPIMIGIKEQLSAQLRYIYRGNYGLVSKEEIMATGTSEELADEMMAMKNRFAFGAIRESHELIETKEVRGNAIEIKNGVYIQRLGLNRYRVEYLDDYVDIDLNLDPDENYETPYPLGFYDIKREYFGVIHSGEGDGWDINRPCMSSVLMFQGKIFLIDAGPNLIASLNALGIGVNEIEGIFHTHAHDDHFAGLTTLMQADHKVKYYATPLVRASVTKKLSALLSFDEDNIGNYFDICDLEFDHWNDIGGLEVKPMLSPHPVETNTFIFRTLWEDGYKTYAHMADICSLETLEGMVATKERPDGISQAFCDKLKANFSIAANVKKIDIGGGMIHGSAIDFDHDPSDKLILSHISRELTHREKEIGSGATFGVVDVMIPDYQDYARRNAYYYLKSYFDTLPHYKLRTLINNSLESYNAGTNLLKEGETNANVYLLLTGNIEMINTKESTYNVLSAGSFIGEMSGIQGVASEHTFRAATFVQLLRIPVSLYMPFIKENDLYSVIRQLQGRREFLQQTSLFGDSVSTVVLNRIAQKMKRITLEEGEVLLKEQNRDLCLVFSGSLSRHLGPEHTETFVKGDFFGEESALFAMPSLLRVKSLEKSEVCMIPGELLHDIPVVHWKLFETYENRKSTLLSTKAAMSAKFVWNDEYGIKNNKIDNHHQKLFDMANIIQSSLDDASADMEMIEDTLCFLVNYTAHHFNEEEWMLKEIAPHEYESHKKLHADFLERVGTLRGLFDVAAQKSVRLALSEFLEHGIIGHILGETERLNHGLTH